MKTILAPIDFSSGTSLIIDEAATLASALHGRLILLHIVDTLPAAAGEFDFAEAAARIKLSATTGAIRELANWQRRLARKGITSLTHHVTGVAGTAIVEQARAFGADYIVVGTRGHGSLYELVIGGTAQRVIKDAHCPVLVVPSAVSRKIPPAPSKSESAGNHRRSSFGRPQNITHSTRHQNIMLHSLRQLYGNKLGATDGEIGHVKDVYFDDRRWAIRYVVADTGSWLPQRQVLLSPHAFGKPDPLDHVLKVKLSRQQIEDSPPIESQRPVSRQYEVEYYRYYGWPVYWVGDGFGGLGGFPGVITVPSEPPLDRTGHSRPEDTHLRSAKAVTGYQVQALDGPVGQVADFLVDEENWAIREIVVQTGHWYSAKRIRISPHDVERISYEQSTLFLLLTLEDVQHAGETMLVVAGGVNRKALGLEE
jgi:nucleotide-binding universal stress UspA family protein